MENIRSGLNKAILQSLAGKYSLYVFQLISLAILSRIFTPEMFGAIATFQVFILFFQLLATSGLAPAIIYQDKLVTLDRDGVFSVTLIIGFIGALLFFVLTPYLSLWLNLTGVDILSWVLAFNILFSSLSMLPMAALQKDAKFLLIAKAEIISEVMSLTACIGLYYCGYGLEALASKLLIVPIFRFVFYYYSSVNTLIGKPRFGRKLSAIYSLMEVAKYQLGFNTMVFLSRNLDTILITKYFGAASVAMYDKSYQIMKYPLQLFTFAITPALQPILTKFRHKPRIIEKEFYRIANRLAVLGLLASMVVFWSAYDVVFILLGPQWQEVVGILRLLAITIPLQMVLSSTGGVYQAFGATKQLLKCGIMSSVTNVAAIVAGIYSGDIKVLCLLLSFSFAVNYFQCFYLLHKNIFKFVDFKKFFSLSCLIFLSYANLLFLNVAPPQHENIFEAIVGVVYTAFFTLLGLILIYFVNKKFKFLDF